MPPRSQTLSDAMTEYELHRKALGVTPQSLNNEMRFLRLLLAHVGNIQLRNMRDRHVDEFFLTRQERLATSTWNHELSMAKTFFKYCERKRWFGPEGNPIAHRKGRKFTPRPRLRIPATEFPRLLDCAEDPRDRAVVALGIYLLMRQSEIQALRVGHVNLPTGEVSVEIPKTRQRDVMPISEELDTELRRWLTAYTEDLGRPLASTDPLIPARHRSRWGEEPPSRYNPAQPMFRPYQAAQRALADAGYDMRDPSTGKSNAEGVHTLRRSAARAVFDQLVDGGYDGALRVVQSLLHHQNSEMTERYLGIELDVKRRDEMFKGKAMFAKPADNVVSLRRAE